MCRIEKPCARLFRIRSATQGITSGPATKRLQQHVVQPKFMQIAKVIYANGHAIAQLGNRLGCSFLFCEGHFICSLVVLLIELAEAN